ncbi:MAG: class I SAM-dependent methyltransferase [Candidatus Nanoarchaeia archaeon]|nr:class I SAM-dependent methyltransferase [Candidatus Nanoarchaeia archaeon]
MMELLQLKDKIKCYGEVPRVGKDTLKFTEVVSKQKGKKVLDLGTGSGFIGIYLALEGREVTSSDINPNALEVAKENAFNLNAEIKFILSDLFNNIHDKFDLILFNPPMGNTTGKRRFEFVKRLIPKTKLTLKLATSLFTNARKDLLKRFVISGRYHLTEKGCMMILLHQNEREYLESLTGKDKIEVIEHYDFYNNFEIIKVHR